MNLVQILHPLSTLVPYFPYLTSVNQLAKYDPLSTLVKLALLQEKPIGTKLSFKQYSFTFEEPGFTQSIQRRAYGEDHTDLANLETPIILATKLYDSMTNKFIKIIFEEAMKGLSRLIETYTPPERVGPLMDQKKILSYKQTQGSLQTYIGYLKEASKYATEKTNLPSNHTDVHQWQGHQIEWIAQGLLNMHYENESKNTMNAIQVFVNKVDGSFAEEMEMNSLRN